MTSHNERELHGALVAALADGFNRALAALEAAGAIDCGRLREKYTGVGSEYYDVVTEQLELTASLSSQGIRDALDTKRN